LVQVEQEAKKEVIVLYTLLHQKVAALPLQALVVLAVVHLVLELLPQVLALLTKVTLVEQQQVTHLLVVEVELEAQEVVQEQVAQVFQLLSQEL
jgi:hypothetical protein